MLPLVVKPLEHNFSTLTYLKSFFFAKKRKGLKFEYIISGGTWDLEHLEIVCMGSATAPVNSMLPVAGKLWCACQNEIMILNPNTLDVEVI